MKRTTRLMFFRIMACLAMMIGLSLSFGKVVQASQSFVAVAFHEVVDTPEQLDDDAVTVDRLIGFFEFLLADGWTALTLDDIEAARLGKKTLPQKSILITFDDGYADLYTRVFPLLKAYRFPIVSALVGQWMDAPMHAKVNYGGELVPRTKFLSWSQAREMQASGLVEFASHSYDQHFSIKADRHGTLIPAMVTYAFEAQANEYENPVQFEVRIRADMQANTLLLARELGVRPRAFVWPYGRYSLKTIELAQTLGYRFALNLNDEPSSAAVPMEIARYLPERNPMLGAMLTDLRHQPGFAPATRVAGFEFEKVWSGDDLKFDQKLGQFIEDIRRLGPTAVAFKPYKVNADGSLQSWFARHDSSLVGSDGAARLAWQLQSRVGVEVYARISLTELRAALGSDERVVAWFDALGRHLPVTGIVFEDAQSWVQELQQPDIIPQGPWDVRQFRRSLELGGLGPTARLALQAFRQAERYRPTIDLIATVRSEGSTSVDSLARWSTVPAAVDLILYKEQDGLPQSVSNQMRTEFAADPARYRRLGIWLGSVASDQSAQQIAQRASRLMATGVSGLGFELDASPNLGGVVKWLAPAVSSSTFPVLF